MKDKELMKGIAEVVDADESLDPRLLALSEGRASEAQLQALEEEAQGDPELAMRLSAYRPLGEAQLKSLERIAARRLSRLWGRLGVVGALAAAAAGITLSLRSPALPDYALEVRAGDALKRGATEPPANRELRADSELEIVLRPQSAHEQPLIARAFATADAGAWHTKLPVEKASTGAARLTGQAGALTNSRTGAVTFVLLIAHTHAKVPSLQSLIGRRASRASILRGDGWQAAFVDVVILPFAAGP